METRRKLTLGYVAALLIIAGLAVLTHSVVTQVLHEQEGAAEVIDVAGRQRMLSQRIALFASQYERTGYSRDRRLLRSAVDLMAQQHEMLVSPSRGTPFHELRTAELERLYGERGLDEQVRSFIEGARRLADGSGGTGAESPQSLELVEVATEELLNGLDQAVQMYEAAADSAIHGLTRIQLYALAILLTVLAAEATLIFRPLVTTVSRQAERLERLAATDELTALLNRRSFTEQATREVQRSNRNGSPLSALVLDLDRFKSVNDAHGHDAGDRVLKACAKSIAAAVRRTDVAGRTGGEEFCLLMPDTSSESAHKLADRLLENMSSSSVAVNGTESVTVTFSGGIAELQSGENLNDLLKRADAAMYEAKQAGRARVITASDSPLPVGDGLTA